jgi:hypothetical protein
MIGILHGYCIPSSIHLGTVLDIHKMEALSSNLFVPSDERNECKGFGS